MPPDGDTTATQLAIVTQKLDQMREEMKQGFARIEARLDDHEDRLRALEAEQQKTSARLTMQNILQTTFATVAAAIAAVLGVFLR